MLERLFNKKCTCGLTKKRWNEFKKRNNIK